jgi:hypothetical protein
VKRRRTRYKSRDCRGEPGGRFALAGARQLEHFHPPDRKRWDRKRWDRKRWDRKHWDRKRWDWKRWDWKRWDWKRRPSSTHHREAREQCAAQARVLLCASQWLVARQLV